MKRRIRLRRPVVRDLSQAADWYDSQQFGLGAEFLRVTFEGFDTISERAESFPIVEQAVRRALMRRFPYAIYFLPESSAVTILAVLHTARPRRTWRRRIR